MPSRKRLCLTAPASRFEVEESSAADAARQTRLDFTHGTDFGFIDILDASIRASKGRVMTIVEEVNERVTDLTATQRQDAHELYVRHEDAQDDRALLRAQISLLKRERRYFRFMTLSYEREKMSPKKTTTPMTDATIKQLIAQGVVDALAEYEANKSSGNGDDSHDSGSGICRTEYTTRECTYSGFLKCQPLNFKGTEGVIVLTQWFEKIESVFHVSSCTVTCQIKFATCT
ncbi:hypothetical protein Tco_0228565 [Tanacetum coccineum]